MKKYAIQGYPLAGTFLANSIEEAANKALKIMNFSYGAREEIERNGPCLTLKRLGFQLEELPCS